MSKNLIHAHLWKWVFQDVDPSISAWMKRLGWTVMPHGMYVYGTSGEKKIRVVSTYQYTCGGYTRFMIVDDDNRHFWMNNTFWYWKWDTIEDWIRVQTATAVDARIFSIRYYGYRLPCLGLFPMVFHIRFESPAQS